MNARQLQDALRDLLEAVLFARDDADDPARELAEHVEGIRQIATYDDVGMLTREKGLVIEARDGSEFQLTIVQSRPAACPPACDAQAGDASVGGEALDTPPARSASQSQGDVGQSPARRVKGEEGSR